MTPTDQATTPPPPETDPYVAVAALDADALLQKHPQLAARLSAQADQQANSRLAAEQQQAADQHKQQLYQRAQAGDPQAELELLDVAKRELGSTYAQRSAQQAEEALRTKLWLRDAAAYDLDGTDPAVLAAVKDAQNLKQVGATLERLRDERQQAKAAKATAQPATSTAAAGDPAAQIAALARRGEKPSPELWAAYRVASGRAPAPPAAPRGRR